ncbi:hypothetical protein AVEN_206531-1 [Araneus ventricosus]|uniref:Uncharacterized protein n=1 Tax=Araneus ventricosus TaxID=182803 RepID=A0A4Y2P7A0_ARAVE|nr:hypothetical protein AVEN_206531-1 [Araneus ventricosus]
MSRFESGMRRGTVDRSAPMVNPIPLDRFARGCSLLSPTYTGISERRPYMALQLPPHLLISSPPQLLAVKHSAIR